MEISLIFKIAGIGILISVIYQILVKSGREDQAMMVTLAGMIIVLTVIIKEIIHPNRKFLRTEVLGYTKTIDLNGYVSILQGVEKAVDKYHAEKTREDRIKKMWKEFEEKAWQKAFSVI